ncbi:MAG: DUF420 domain-containing protein [Acidobacteriota bacterium]|nr:MAG: DUF420 domain-containing protein [Acidobacteriota bacterium]
MLEVSSLPTVNAILNTVSAVLLAIGYLLIRQGKRLWHRNAMLGALATSALFLTSYLIYHYNIGSKSYEGEGTIRIVYFTVLLSHTVLATAIVPLVILTLVRAFKGQFERHQQIARWTLPLWIYVSVTGVVIYLMLYGF